MTRRNTPFFLARPDERPIHGCWHWPEAKAKGTVLFLHGYKGYMDWGAWNLVGDRFASEGWRFLRINFTHNGTSPSEPSAFVDLPAFGANTHRRELEETLAVIHALRSPSPGAVPSQTDSDYLAIAGHSRGGGIAALSAFEADRSLREQGLRGIDALITWAAVADFHSRFPSGEALEEWEKSGQLEVINHRTRQRLHHDWSFYTDFQDHAERLHIESAVRRYPGPSLIAHATDDAAVDVEHAQAIAGWAQHPTLNLLEQGGHTFGAAEPWTEPHLPDALAALTQTTLRFLEEGRAVQKG